MLRANWNVRKKKNKLRENWGSESWIKTIHAINMREKVCNTNGSYYILLYNQFSIKMDLGFRKIILLLWCTNLLTLDNSKLHQMGVHDSNLIEPQGLKVLNRPTNSRNDFSLLGRKNLLYTITSSSTSRNISS